LLEKLCIVVVSSFYQKELYLVSIHALIPHLKRERNKEGEKYIFGHKYLDTRYLYFINKHYLSFFFSFYPFSNACIQLKWSNIHDQAILPLKRIYVGDLIEKEVLNECCEIKGVQIYYSATNNGW